jgi:hypothetical protein
MRYAAPCPFDVVLAEAAMALDALEADVYTGPAKDEAMARAAAEAHFLDVWDELEFRRDLVEAMRTYTFGWG